MPQLIAFAVIGAGLYAGYRLLARLAENLEAELKRANDEINENAAGQVEAKDLGALEYDAGAGVYRPARPPH
jgi:hypothetical protein